MWNVVNKVLKGGSAAPVQPLRTEDGEFDFDDATISDRMTARHITRDNTPTDRFDSQWLTTVDAYVANCITAERTNMEIGNDVEEYNSDIRPHETQAAMDLTNQDSAPGPDKIIPKFVLKSGAPEALHHLSRISWYHACFPSEWKMDNRIYHPKPLKDDFHEEGSYRPISLTAVCGKLHERIISRRLFAILRAKGFFDQPQFAYLKGLDTTQALLTLVLHVKHGFKNKENTVAAMIDLAGAFDAVWRNGVLYKLHKLGITGRLFLSIVDFFKNRHSRNLINKHISKWIITDVGVPQGSILAVLLFIIFVMDLGENAHNQLKYADDIYLWVTHKNLHIAASILEADLASVDEWCSKWRQTCSQSKTEIMAFTPRGHAPVTVRLNNIPLKQVNVKRCLGVHVDENMNFKVQAIEAGARGSAALRKVSVFTRDLGGASMEVLTALYTACVRTHMLFSYAAWSSVADIKKLETVQYQALKSASGAMDKTSASALEVLWHVPPLDLCMEQAIINTFGQIYRQPDNYQLKVLVKDFLKSKIHLDHRHISPIHKYKMAKKHLCPDLDLEASETIVFESISDIFLVPVPIKSFTDSVTLGNTKTRTKEQALLARKLALEYLISLKEDIIAFTDGSALGNPGPCGSGVVVFWKGLAHHHTTHSRPISPKSTSYHAELGAIDLTFDVIDSSIHSKPVHIITDCKSALAASSSSNACKNHTDLQMNIWRKHQPFVASNTSVRHPLGCWPH